MLGVRQIASAAENGVEAAPGLLELISNTAREYRALTSSASRPSACS
jgi:hypothetical protein